MNPIEGNLQVILFWLGLALMCLPLMVLLSFWGVIHLRVDRIYLPRFSRIFTERPLFIVPRGKALEDAETVRFPTSDGLTLRGCYLKATGARRGVILFALEFTSDCWSCRSYCDHLVANGYDVFAYEPRGQGQSDPMPGYEPMQWVTDYEVNDAKAAIAYLEGRPDADPRGVGLFGISKGAGAAVLAASRNPYVRCAVTDGMFATNTTLLPYMSQFFVIYKSFFPEVLIPEFYYRVIAFFALRLVRRERHCSFPSLERELRHLGPRPLLMIHGAQDKYIKPEMAQKLFDLSGGKPERREFWLVEGAKHNQALNVANAEYHERVLSFFDQHLGGEEPCPLEVRCEAAMQC